MTDEALRVGCMDYDRTRPLFDGRATIEDFDVSVKRAPVVSEIFEGMLRHRAFDVAELGLTFYLRTLDSEDPPFIALRIFPLRHLRHSAISSTPPAASKRRKTSRARRSGACHDCADTPTRPQ